MITDFHRLNFYIKDGSVTLYEKKPKKPSYCTLYLELEALKAKAGR
jgi:hypothetical protein